MKKTFEVLARIYSNPIYFLITAGVAFLFYLLNGLLLNYSNIFSFYSNLDFFSATGLALLVSLNFLGSVLPFTYYGILLLSILIGVLISLLVYRFKEIEAKDLEKTGFFGVVGIFLGAAAPGCVACGVGILSALGLSSVLLVLPFEGKEVLIVAVGLLVFSIIGISRKLYNPVCQVNFSKMKGGKNE